MPSNARAERRRNERANRKARQGRRFGHEYENAGVMVAWCVDEPDAIEQAKKATHDGLIQYMGEQRRGGVTWQVHKETAAKVASDLIATTRPDEPQEVRDYYRRIAAHVREYGGCVVIAYASGQPS